MREHEDRLMKQGLFLQADYCIWDVSGPLNDKPVVVKSGKLAVKKCKNELMDAFSIIIRSDI